MKISVVVVHFGNQETTSNCLKELSKKIGDNQVILINNTADDIKLLTKIIKDTRLINNETNVGFAKAVNQGIMLALKDKSISHVLLLNNDARVTFGSLNQLLQTYNRYEAAGIVAPVLQHVKGYDWGGKLNKWSGMIKHKNWDNKPKTIQTVQHVAAAAMLISRQLIDKVGLFDERFFLYFEDLDYCLRAAKGGFTVHINPDIVAEHYISKSTNLLSRLKYQWRSHFQFVNKHMFVSVLPTSYILDLFIYPIWIVRAVIYGR